MLIFEEDYKYGFYAVGDEVMVKRWEFTPEQVTYIIKLTREGLDCDCGKGLFCPLHEQRTV